MQYDRPCFIWELSFQDINASVIDKWFEYPSRIQTCIDATWKEKVLESRLNGAELWDGNNYQLESMSFESDILTIRLGYVKYRNITNVSLTDETRMEIAKLPLSERVSGIFVAGFIESNDGFLVFWELAGKFLRKAGEIEIIGWVLQPDEIDVHGIEDIFDGFLKELSEEVGLDRECVQEKRFLGLATQKNGNTGAIFYVHVNKSHEEILSDFNRNNDGEMSGLVFIAKDAVESVLELKEGGVPLARLYRDFLK